jgi:chlorobactene glucosyltransferase
MRLRIGEVNREGSPAAYANGAFMLVRRTMYEALGGHARVRDQLNDDIALAHLAKAEGYCLRIAGNADLVRTRMYGSARQAWNGWARNFYGTLRTPRSLGLALGGTLALFVVPWVLLLTSAALAVWGAPGWGGAVLSWGAAVLVSHVGAWAVAWGLALRPAASLLYLPGALFVSAIVARAWGRAWRNTSMVWQGARYAPGSAPRASGEARPPGGA